MNGWIKIHRSLIDHWIFAFDGTDKALAWIDLIMMARHEDGEILLKSRVQTVKRGQVAMSQLSLQKRWNWSQNKVKRFLKLLKNERMIVFETNELTTLVSICNYDSFQDYTNTDERPDERPDERRYKKERKKEVNNGGKIANKPSRKINYTSEFEELWKTYPKRPGGNPKEAAFKAYKKRLTEYSHEDLLGLVSRYAKFCESTQCLIQHTSTFFGSKFDPDCTWSIPVKFPIRQPQQYPTRKKENVNDYL